MTVGLLNGPGTSGPNQAVPDDDTVLLLWGWCTLREGVTWAVIADSRKEFVQGLSDRGVRGSSSLMFPFLGTRNGLGKFTHVFVSPDWAAIAAYHEYVRPVVGGTGWTITAMLPNASVKMSMT